MVKTKIMKNTLAAVVASGIIGGIPSTASAMDSCEDLLNQGFSKIIVKTLRESDKCLTKGGITQSEAESLLKKAKEASKAKSKVSIKETREARVEKLGKKYPKGRFLDNLSISNSSGTKKFNEKVSGIDYNVNTIETNRINDLLKAKEYRIKDISKIKFDEKPVKNYKALEVLLKAGKTKINDISFVMKETRKERIARLKEKENERTVVIDELLVTPSVLPEGTKTEEKVLKSVVALSTPTNSKTRYAIVLENSNGRPIFGRVDGKNFYITALKIFDNGRTRNKDGAAELEEEESKIPGNLELAVKSAIAAVMNPTIESSTNFAYALRNELNDTIKSKGLPELMALIESDKLLNLEGDKKFIKTSKTAKYNQNITQEQKDAARLKNIKKTEQNYMRFKSGALKKVSQKNKTESNPTNGFSPFELVVAGANYAVAGFSAEKNLSGNKNFEAFAGKESIMSKVVSYLLPINYLRTKNRNGTLVSENKGVAKNIKIGVTNYCLTEVENKTAVDYFTCGSENTSSIFNSIEKAFIEAGMTKPKTEIIEVLKK